MSHRTLEDTLALPPGDELDQEIAVRVFGMDRPERAYSRSAEGYSLLFEFMIAKDELRRRRDRVTYRGHTVPFPADQPGRQSALCRLALLGSGN